MADETVTGTQPVPALPAALSAAQRARFEAIAALARATVARLPRPMAKTLEPAHAFGLHKREPLS